MKISLRKTLACFVGVLGVVATTAPSAQAAEDNRIRFKLRDSSTSVCLTSTETSAKPMVVERCDTDNPYGNWRKIVSFGNGTTIMLQNVGSGECLDSGAGLEALVYTSPCNINDTGQVWYYFCDTGRVMSAPYNTVLTAWSDNKVSMRPTNEAFRQRWDRKPDAC